MIGRKKVLEVFLVDFGLAKEYIDENGVLHEPRDLREFRGTV